MNKTQHDKIADRLAQILLKLNCGERLTITELSEEFNVDKRTIQRDLRRLSSLPIKKENGYYALETYALGRLSLEDIKVFAMASGIQALYPSLSNDFILKLLDKINNSAYLVKNYEYENTQHKNSDFELITDAIVNHNVLSFVYKGTQRTANPYKLINKHGIWYLLADECGTLKNFGFSKILNPQVNNASFAPNQEFLETIKKNELGWLSQNSIEVTLKIEHEATQYFLRRKLLPNQQIIEQTSEYLLLSTKASYEEEILGTVQYWIPHISIVSPPHLQEKLNGILQEYLKTHDR